MRLRAVRRTPLDPRVFERGPQMSSTTQPGQAAAHSTMRARLRTARAAFAETLADASRRRAQLGFGATLAAQWGFTVGLAVVAFRAGGAVAVGLVTALCVIPSAVLVPLSAALADRLPRERILVAAALLMAATTAGIGAAVAVGL